MIKKYLHNKIFLTGFCMFSFMFILMLLSFIWIPYDYNELNMSDKFSPFSFSHLLGTDFQGRDVFSRILIATRISFFIGFTVMTAGFITGIILGSVSGYFGGVADLIIMKIINTKMAFPGILLALMLVAVSGGGFGTTILALTIMSIPRYTRITRAGYIKYKNSLFVLSARAKGASALRIMYLHILPNIISDLSVTCTLSFALAILSESGLSYLGLGVPIDLPSFGQMLSEGKVKLFQSAAAVLVPAFFLTVLVLGLNLMGDGIYEENRK